MVARYNSKMYRAAVILLLLILAGLQYRLWVADGSWAQVHHLQVMHNQLMKANAKARARNNRVQAQISDLKAGAAATEDRARDEMGMIKPGETFFLTEPGGQTTGSGGIHGAG